MKNFLSALAPLREKLFFFSLLISFASFSQTNPDLPSGSSSYTVESGYNPTLANAKKESYAAQLPALDTTKPTLSYSVPTKLLNIPFKPADLKPLPMKDKIVADDLQNNIAKVGFGTQLSPFVMLRYNSGASQKYNFGIAADYMSGKGKLDFQQFSYGKYDANFSVLGKKITTSFDANFNHDVVYFYGYNHSDTSLHYTTNDLRQRFNDFNFSAGIKNAKVNKAKINYSVGAAYYNFNDLFGKSENNISGNILLDKNFNTVHHIGLNVDLFDNDFKNDSVSSSYFHVGINPFYQYKTSGGNIKVGVKEEIENGVSYVFPQINGEKQLVGSNLILFGGLDGHVEFYSFRNLIHYNPFLSDNLTLNNSRIDEQFAGLRGNYGNHFSWKVKFGNEVTSRFPIYPIENFDNKNYSVQFATSKNMSTILLNTELGWRQNEKMNILFNFCYYSYYFLSQLQNGVALGHEIVSSSIDFNYNLSKNLLLNSKIFYRSFESSGQFYPTSNFDLNIGADYNFKENFVFWVRLNNITSQQYQRWYNYPSYGFNVVGGVGLKF